MSCRGYDSKAVKISKSVKRAAAQFLDKHERGAFIRSFVKIAQNDFQARSSRKESK